jgi:hypothetical protein
LAARVVYRGVSRDLVIERGWNPERFAERLAEILRATLTEG